MSEETPSVPATGPEAEVEKESGRLTEAQWLEVCQLRGEDWSLPRLEEKFGISQAALSAGLKRRGVERGDAMKARAAAVKTAATSATVTAAVAAAKSFADQRLERIEETKENHYKWADTLAKLAMKEIIDASTKKLPFSTVDANLRALRRAVAILNVARIERFEILDAMKHIDEDELPELHIENYTDDELKMISKRSAEGDELDRLEMPEISIPDTEVVVEGDEK